MRSVECPDAAAASPAEQVSVRKGQADFDRRHQVLDQPQVDLDQPQVDSDLPQADSGLALADSGLALAFEPLVQRELEGCQHLLLPIHSRRGHLFPAITILSGLIAGLVFTIFIIIISVFLTPALDASRPSSALDYFGVRPSILPTTVTTIPITMERRRRNRLS